MDDTVSSREPCDWAEFQGRLGALVTRYGSECLLDLKENPDV